jgi:hypothetical protein
MNRSAHPSRWSIVCLVVLLAPAVFAVPIKREPKEKPMSGPFAGRFGEAKDKLVKEGGGNADSEAAVAAGLKWIVKHQKRDGSWSLDRFPCNCVGWGGHRNDVAGTAFGLLPLLGAGYTHKIDKTRKNPYRGNVLLGLQFLMRKQDRRTGTFAGSGNAGSGMYAHGLATIALCEAYGMTKDPRLKRSAQAAVNYLLRAQHPAGGWRYSPGQVGDTSVTGWQVSALRSAHAAGLTIPKTTLDRAIAFINSCMDANTSGYGYLNSQNPATPTTAIGLLCRQHLQGYDRQNESLAHGVKNYLEKSPPGSLKNMYYYYYATRVMHHFGGKVWEKWNEKMRDGLIKSQDQGTDPRHAHRKGSWLTAGDPWSGAGGRLMETSLSLLTLEVYYRALPFKKAERKEKLEK